MIQVYSTKTGEARPAHAVDAREMVQRGGWSYEPVEIVPTEPVYTAPTPVEVAAEPVPLAQSVEMPAAKKERKAKTERKPRKPKSA